MKIDENIIITSDDHPLQSWHMVSVIVEDRLIQTGYGHTHDEAVESLIKKLAKEVYGGG